MPFLDQIVTYINDSLKAGSLNNKKLQPSKLFGLTTQVARKKDVQGGLELLPAIVHDNKKVEIISVDDKQALQIYHKVLTTAYRFEKKSYGPNYEIVSVSEMSMVVICNSKLTGVAKEQLEPVVLFSIPQKISAPLIADLKIINCLITPVSSNMDAPGVFRQEYPQGTYFLNEFMSMFLIRYKIEMSFSQACVDKCLC